MKGKGNNNRNTPPGRMEEEHLLPTEGGPSESRSPLQQQLSTQIQTDPAEDKGKDKLKLKHLRR